MEQQFEGPAQDLGALARRRGRPAGLCLTGDRDGLLGIGGGTVGHGGDDLTGCGIADVDGLAAFGLTPTAADE